MVDLRVTNTKFPGLLRLKSVRWERLSVGSATSGCFFNYTARAAAFGPSVINIDSAILNRRFLHKRFFNRHIASWSDSWDILASAFGVQLVLVFNGRYCRRSSWWNRLSHYARDHHMSFAAAT
jgi:hypothetical protein